MQPLNLIGLSRRSAAGWRGVSQRIGRDGPALARSRCEAVGLRGSAWVPVGLRWSLWFPVDPRGSLWIPVGPHGSLGSRGSPWTPVSLWVPVGPSSVPPPGPSGPALAMTHTPKAHLLALS